jgi:hypothetical protein
MERPPDPQLVGFLERSNPLVSEIALALRETILEEAPDALESIYLGARVIELWFGFSKLSKETFCYVTAHAAHVNLGFPWGASLPDPHRALVGLGKTNRQIRFESVRDLERSFVRPYIQAAIDQAAPTGTRGKGTTVINISAAASTATRKPSKAGSPRSAKAKKPRSV